MVGAGFQEIVIVLAAVILDLILGELLIDVLKESVEGILAVATHRDHLPRRPRS